MAIALNAVQMPFVMSSQWSTPLIHPATSMRTYFKLFLNGQPKALGTLQISAAFIQISLGVVLYFVSFFSYANFTIDSGLPFWGSILYIISGALSVAAENHESSCLIGGSLAMNIVSSLASAMELGLLAADISDFTDLCDTAMVTSCDNHEVLTWIIRMIVLISLIIVSLLEFCVAISVSSFGCRALSYKSVESFPQESILILNECWTGQPARPHTLIPSSIPLAAPPLHVALYGDQKTSSNPPLSPVA